MGLCCSSRVSCKASRPARAWWSGGRSCATSTPIGHVPPRCSAYIATVFGVAPIVAPLIGAALLPLGWRAIYAALAAVGALMWVAVLYLVPETAPEHPGRRHFRSAVPTPGSSECIGLCRSPSSSLLRLPATSPSLAARRSSWRRSLVYRAVSMRSRSRSPQSALLIGSYVSARLTHRLGSEWLLAAGCYAFAVVGVATFVIQVVLGHAEPRNFRSAHGGLVIPFWRGRAARVRRGTRRSGSDRRRCGCGARSDAEPGRHARQHVERRAYGFAPTVNVGWCAGVAGLIVLAAYRASTIAAPERVASVPQ